MKTKKPSLAVVLWDGERYSADSELLERIEKLEKRFKEVKAVDTRLNNIMTRLLKLEAWKKELEDFLRARLR